jgi:exopolyphosphatase / guanosine-5'-triphosphate,3'-diphosphate pyrophosphatase
MRVAVVDIGSNSTRLLIADVDDGRLTELERRSIVTRLGEGVDAAGVLQGAAQQRVFDVLDDYARAMDRHGCEARAAVMTSAVRDACNGREFAAGVRERYGLDTRTLAGDEEAELTFRGATASGDPEDSAHVLVVDIGGGSTELVVGSRGEMGFHVSTQIGVVRHGERHLHHDPPAPEELQALRAEVRDTVAATVPPEVRERTDAAIAVAGTPTMCAAIDLELEPYDSRRVEGHRLTAQTLGEQLELLANLPLERRRAVIGLHPDRAPTIVAGVAVLLEVLDAFGIGATSVSERDILWGVALTMRSTDGYG